MKQSMENMVSAISQVLGDNAHSIYLYGSVPMNDFRLGWSDIDILCLTEQELTPVQAEQLVSLRQEMLKKEGENPYYRSFEGGILSIATLLNPPGGAVVYWGTSGQRITNQYRLDSFARYGLLRHGQLLSGKDIRELISPPSFDELKRDIRAHDQTIQEYACSTGRSLYAFGWLLDISRCLYTLQTGKLIAKTRAGEWALENRLCPVEQELEYALKVRKDPMRYKNIAETLDYAAGLGPKIQAYGRVLAAALEAIQ